MPDYGYHLDVSGRQTRSIYTQICLCFQLPDDASRSSVTDTLNNGLKSMAASIPWTAGYVVQDADGWPFVKQLFPRRAVVVKDLQLGIPMQELRKRAFPISSFDEGELCPMRTLPESMGVWPVFLVQANFVQGGLLLACMLQHQVGDMVALAQVLYYLHKACKNEVFTEVELKLANVDRKHVIPLHDPRHLSKDGTNQGVPPLRSRPANQSTSDTAALSASDDTLQSCLTWTNFSIAPTELITLKAEAMKTLPEGSFVSTDDTLSALVWRHITRARLPRLESEVITQFGRTVDMRGRLGIEDTYPGEVSSKAFVRYDAKSLAWDMSVGTIASALRTAIDPKVSTIIHDFTSHMTLTQRAKSAADKPKKQVELDLSKDVMLSSWVKFGELWALDFGLGLGKPESVRRPLFRPTMESLVYLLPRKADGEIVIVLCLRQDDLDRLRQDKEWMKWTTWIG